MKLLRLPVLTMIGSLLVLTYLLVQGRTPDPVQHEATLNAMRMLATNDAALQRDVLRARGGSCATMIPWCGPWMACGSSP